MPKLYEYLGIVIMFFSNEHEPIHIHANYDGNGVKVSFFIENDKIYKITYKATKGEFTAVKLKQLKEFIGVYQQDIIQAWIDYFILKKKVKLQRITKKL